MIYSILIKNRNLKLCGVVFFAWKYTSISVATSSEEPSFKYLGMCKDKLGYSQMTSTFRNISSFEVGETVFELHKRWSQRFSESGIPDSDTSIRYIIEHVLNMEKAYEYELDMRRKITENEGKQIGKLCECRLARMPVQYIIKEWDFRDLKLAMCPPVFIPRPETEQLVDLVLERTPADAAEFLEVGCGSGAICLSLLKALPHARVIAVDQSKVACHLTKKNAKLNKLDKNLQVVHSKLEDDGNLSQPLELNNPVDVLVSNPPYVPYAQLQDLEPEIKLYEDMRALEGGWDGLRVVRSLLVLAQSVLKPKGRIFLEVDSTHPKLIEKWITKHPELNIKFVQSYKDYCDRDRFVELEKI